MSERKEELSTRLRLVQSQIIDAARSAGRDPEEVTLIAVTKNFPLSDAEILYELGIRNFGENRDQEGSVKAPAIADDAIWHFQGQIQSKKIKSIVQWADFTHSLDDLSHAEKFNAYAGHKFFIQVSLDPAATHRGGVPLEELGAFYSALSEFANIDTCGLMVVPPVDASPGASFATVAAAARELGLSSLSMGMSGDFPEAIAHGATHIRVGSSILGNRSYPA